MTLHPDIEREWAMRHKRMVMTSEDMHEIYQIAVRWIARRASQICAEYQGGKPSRSALDQACEESGMRISEQQRRQIWEANQRELDDTTKCPIVVTSEREYRDAIEEARARGDLFIGSGYGKCPQCSYELATTAPMKCLRCGWRDRSIPLRKADV